MKRISHGRIWLVVLLVALVAGCATTGVPQLPICPGKASAEDALATLGARAAEAVPFRVSGGQCRLTYYVPDDDDPKTHNLPLQLWFQPPSEMYIQGAIAVDPKALVVGCNSKEFWLALRPKEMSAYYWGKWDEAANVEGLIVSPQIVLEAFGIIGGHEGQGNVGNWSLSNEGPYDVLTYENSSGQIAKRVYIYTCDYRVRKIEYFDREGKIAATAELDDYEPVTPDFLVPTKIHVTAVNPDGRADVAEITLSSLKEKQLSQAARDRYFQRQPDEASAYEHVYRYENGHWTAE